jgi:hypothetical protein
LFGNTANVIIHETDNNRDTLIVYKTNINITGKNSWNYNWKKLIIIIKLTGRKKIRK